MQKLTAAAAPGKSVDESAAAVEENEKGVGLQSVSGSLKSSR